MSKYIRTENGIYKVKEEVTVNNVGNENVSYFPNQNGYIVYSKYNFSGEFIPKVDVIGESDNLENLLDVFLCENKLGQGTCSRDFEELRRDALHYTWQQFSFRGKTWDELQYTFYGLIKVNHNLICVAEYNEDKKEWELINNE